MVPLNYHQLYYFWMIAKAGSISRARKELYLAQPTLSLQMKQLEAALKVKLLERGRRGVALTPDGRIVFDYCERIFTQGEELAAALEKGGTLKSPLLRLGFLPSVPNDAVLEVHGMLRKRHPRVLVRVMGGALLDLVEQLRGYSLDVALSDNDFAGALGVEFRSRLAGRVPIFFVATPWLKRQIGKFPSCLGRVPLLLRAPEDPLRKQVDLFLHRNRIRANLAAEVEDSEILRALALSGQGVAALDSLSIAQDLRGGRLVKLHKSPLRIHQQLWFVAGRHPKPNPILRAAIETIMTDFQTGIR